MEMTEPVQCTPPAVYRVANAEKAEGMAAMKDKIKNHTSGGKARRATWHRRVRVNNLKQKKITWIDWLL